MKAQSVLKLFQLSHGDFIFFLACLQHDQTQCLVRSSNIPKLGHADLPHEQLDGVFGLEVLELDQSSGPPTTIGIVYGNTKVIEVIGWSILLWS